MIPNRDFKILLRGIPHPERLQGRATGPEPKPDQSVFYCPDGISRKPTFMQRSTETQWVATSQHLPMMFKLCIGGRGRPHLQDSLLRWQT